MAAQSILDAIDAINTEIATHEVAIERLVVARKALGDLLTVDDTVGDAEGHVPAPKSTRVSTRKAKSTEAKPEAAPSNGEALVEAIIKQTRAKSSDAPKGKKGGKSTPAPKASPSGKKALASLREQRIENLAKARAAKAAKQGNGDKPNRREQIIALLQEGLSPKEIGTELGIAPNYVYHVKRSLA